MKKVFTFSWLALMATASYAGQANDGDFSLLFHNRMEPRSIINPIPEPACPSNPGKGSAKRFVKENKDTEKPGIWATQWSNGAAPRLMAAAKNAEKMDSIVMTNLAGDKISRQILEYDEKGAPTYCYNEVPGTNGVWERISYYSYEYDDLGRMIARERISLDPDVWYENVRYEFIYTDDSDLFSMQIVYAGSEEGLVPYQRGEYTYKYGNPYEQVFYSWNSESQDWIPAEKKVTDWLDEELQSSFFFYYWDPDINQWYGYSRINPAQTYEYTASGKDAKITSYDWKDNAWLAYEEDIYNYNERDLLISLYRNYWNVELQNWDGPYVSQNGMYNYNTYCISEYDDKDRMTLATWYYAPMGGEYGDEPFPSSSFGYEYTDYPTYQMTDPYEEVTYDLTDVEEVRFTLSIMGRELGTLVPYQKITQRYTRFNSEIYFNNGGDENIRYIDNNNMYHGGDFYGFKDGSRFGQARERFYFAQDWDGLHDTPILGIHWNGIGYYTDTDWVLSSRDEFEWSHDFIVNYTGYAFDDFGENPTLASGYAGEYDWNVPCDDIIRWPLGNRSDAFYAYKAIWEEQYQNYNTDDKWDDIYSYRTDFYYSTFVTSGADQTIGTDAVEVERYDAAGIRLTSPAKGLNIVKYSDGSVRKVMVK